jgi:hypothetical protein
VEFVDATLVRVADRAGRNAALNQAALALLVEAGFDPAIAALDAAVLRHAARDQPPRHGVSARRWLRRWASFRAKSSSRRWVPI